MFTAIKAFFAILYERVYDFIFGFFRDVKDHAYHARQAAKWHLEYLEGQAVTKFDKVKVFAHKHKNYIVGSIVGAIIGLAFVLLHASFAGAGHGKTIANVPHDIDKHRLAFVDTVPCGDGRSFTMAGFASKTPEKFALKYVILFERVGSSVEVRVVIKRAMNITGETKDGELVEEPFDVINIYMVALQGVPTETFHSLDEFSAKYKTACDLPQALAGAPIEEAEEEEQKNVEGNEV